MVSEKITKNMKTLLSSILLLILIIFLASGIVSCGLLKEKDSAMSMEDNSSEVVAAETTKDTLTTQSSQSEIPLLEEIKADFEILAEKETNPLKIFEFIDKNISFVDEDFADEMVDFILEFSACELIPFSPGYDKKEIQGKIWSDYDGTTDLNILKNSTDEAISGLAQETLDRKYKLISSEGFIWPIVDYKAYKKYSPYLSEQMNAFLDIMATESEKPPVSDAGLTVSLEEYVNRIISLYEFENKYRGFIRIYYIVNMLNGSLWVYMGGIDNTPVFDFNGNIIQERLDDFKMNAEKYKDTEFGDKLKEYLDLLDAENNKRTKKVADYIENITFY